MHTTRGNFSLQRNPVNAMLRAWDAADEYLLAQLAEMQLQPAQTRTLVVNDAFGALGVALAEFHPTMVTDSWLAQQALTSNLRANGIAESSLNYNDGLHPVDLEADLVLIKIPKSLALLEYQLYWIRSCLSPDTVILAAGMTREIHNSTLALFEKIIGPTTSSLARKKARLIFATRDAKLNQGQIPEPQLYIVETDREFRLANQANVFSRDRLDPGSRLMIEHMPVAQRYKNIADLGCGNGVLGIIAASLNLEARLLFCDESYMAVDSALQNFHAAFGDEREVEGKVDDGLQHMAPESLDLVLNNPPFHQQHTVGDSIAWKMFVDARRTLRANGELWVVGNRHLGYHAKLKKIFGNCDLVASHKKFVLLRAIRP